AISFESFPCSHKERTSTAGANPRTNARGEAAQKFRDCFVTAFLAMTKQKLWRHCERSEAISKS
ncbi:MAG: hypothetical protein ACRESU_06585, partial [Gammaproteobacteria bacterium]